MSSRSIGAAILSTATKLNRGRFGGYEELADMRRKRDSKRRWKARCRLGRSVPLEAIENFSLTRWYAFECVNDYTHFYVARPMSANQQ